MKETEKNLQLELANQLVKFLNKMGFSAYDIKLHTTRWEEITLSVYLKDKKGFLYLQNHGRKHK